MVEASLLDSVRELRQEHPEAGVKVLLSKLKQLRPDCSIGAKELRSMLGTLDAAPTEAVTDSSVAEVASSLSAALDLSAEPVTDTAIAQLPPHERAPMAGINWAAAHLHLIEPHCQAQSNDMILMLDLRVPQGKHLGHLDAEAVLLSSMFVKLEAVEASLRDTWRFLRGWTAQQMGAIRHVARG
eukprot:2642836-Prymnesium_polylepis.1